LEGGGFLSSGFPSGPREVRLLEARTGAGRKFDTAVAKQHFASLVVIDKG